MWCVCKYGVCGVLWCIVNVVYMCKYGVYVVCIWCSVYIMYVVWYACVYSECGVYE